MISFDHTSIQFDDNQVLHDVSLTIEEGSLALVVGHTGSGKSTLLRTINGLVPHFSGGTMQGRVLVDGRDTRYHRPRDLAGVVGFVDQNPLASFVTETVEDEIAYAMESMGVPRDQMRRRVEETLDLLGIAALRRRALRTLSGGEQQRVAIASVVSAGPRIVVLDEPTSALDPVAAEEVLATLSRLVHDLAMTVVLAEHRLERVVHLADQLIIVEGPDRAGPGGTVRSGEPAELMESSPVTPPVVELGCGLGLSPLPLSVRDARRRTTGLRDQLRSEDARAVSPSSSDTLLTVDRLGVDRASSRVLRDVTVHLHAGEVVALMGRNGSGKTTALSCIADLLSPASGSITAAGRVGMVPQDPSLILYAETVVRECLIADRDAAAEPGTTRRLWLELLPQAAAIPDSRHPRDLSEGQRLSLALAIILTGRPDILLLDEPTRGLDYASKRLLVHWITTFIAEGRTVLLSTHDVELVAEACDRVIILGEGEVVSDRPVREALVGSLAFAPQVTKVMHPLPLLTVQEALAATAGVGVTGAVAGAGGTGG